MALLPNLISNLAQVTFGQAEAGSNMISGNQVSRRRAEMAEAMQTAIREAERMIMITPTYAIPGANDFWAAANVAPPPVSPVAVAAPVEPTTMLLAAPDQDQRAFLTDYQRLARKIGYQCHEADQELAEGDLVAFLHDNGMPVYDYAAVTRYLDGVVMQMNAGLSGWDRTHNAWHWAPLRKCDVRFNAAAREALPPYTKPIPYPVLLTIEKVVAQFGEGVTIEVSDIYTVPKADPFLAVSVPGTEHRFVIERWDEPKFRG